MLLYIFYLKIVDFLNRFILVMILASEIRVFHIILEPITLGPFFLLNNYYLNVSA